MNANRVRTTLCAFLAYFIMSGMLAQAGLITRAMAEHFALDIAEVTARFSWYGGGVLLGSVLAVLLLERVAIARVVRGTAGAIAMSLLLLWLSDSFAALRVWLTLVGVLGGIALAAAAFVITRTFDDRMRASMLLATDLSFSSAGIVMSLVVTALLAAGAIWSAGYLVVAAAAGLLLLLAACSRFPEQAQAGAGPGPALPFSIWCCGLGLLGYTFAQTTLMLWLPTILVEDLGASAAQAGAAVGGYWTGMAAGQVGLFFLVMLLPLAPLLGVLLAVALGLTLVLPLLGTPGQVNLAVFALGVASSGVLKLTISWASLRLPDPPPRLVSVLLMCATTGTALAPAVSARVVTLGSMSDTLLLAIGGYGLLTLALAAAMLLANRPGAVAPSAP